MVYAPVNLVQTYAYALPHFPCVAFVVIKVLLPSKRYTEE